MRRLAVLLVFTSFVPTARAESVVNANEWRERRAHLETALSTVFRGDDAAAEPRSVDIGAVIDELATLNELTGSYADEERSRIITYVVNGAMQSALARSDLTTNLAVARATRAFELITSEARLLDGTFRRIATEPRARSMRRFLYGVGALEALALVTLDLVYLRNDPHAIPTLAIGLLGGGILWLYMFAAGVSSRDNTVLTAWVGCEPLFVGLSLTSRSNPIDQSDAS